jgi:myo-inositol-1(or 4)-monophosphatase
MLAARFGDPGLISPKAGDGAERVYDVVTELDYAVEAYAEQEIRKLAPDSALLAEEGGIRFVNPAATSTPEAMGNPALIDDLWILDPLDGTINFAHGIPMFCVSLARYRKGVPVAGVIYAPVLGELYRYVAGEPATLNGEPIHVRDNAEPGSAVMGVGWAPEDFLVLAPKFRAWRRIGSAALSLAWVARGLYDAYLQFGTLAPWDHAVGAPLVVAAGGTITTHEFLPWTNPLEGWTGAVAGSPDMHRVVHEALRS